MITGIVNTKKGEMRLPPGAIKTSESILFFDELFDSFNGKKIKDFQALLVLQVTISYFSKKHVTNFNVWNLLTKKAILLYKKMLQNA